MFDPSINGEGRGPTDQDQNQNAKSTKITKDFDVYGQLEVSFYNSHRDVIPAQTQSIKEALDSIRGEKYKAAIDKIRLLKSKESARPLKSKLPGHTFSGTFTKRNNDSLERFSSLICLDFDEIENADQFRDELKSFPFIYSAWLSPRGTGVKALACIPSVEHDPDFKIIFQHLQKVFPDIDNACCDISRFCYVSHDPKLWVNPEAEIFNPTVEIDDFPSGRPGGDSNIPDRNNRQTPLNDFDFTMSSVKYYVEQLVSRGFSCDDYKDWIDIGFELASLGEEGRDYYHELSTKSTKYDYQKCDAKFSELLRKHNGKRNIGSFIQRCIDDGISKFHPHAGASRMAPPKSNTRQEVTTINLPEGIAFNIITHGLTYHGKPLDNKKLHDLWWSTPKRPGFDNYYHQLIALAPTWNPYTDFFSSPWSGIDQFEILGKYIDTGEGFTRELRRHIIRGINQLLGVPGSNTHHINRFAFILQGGMNIGKSEFLRRLTLRDVLPGFSSEIDMGQSKTEVHRLLCQCVNLINEEIDSVTAQEVRNLKPIISYSGGSLRLPYDRTPTQMHRIATLWGSVNPGEFLLETNDRWIVYEIRGIDFGYTAAVDFADLWRQCYAEWKKNPLAGELKKSEVDALSEMASAHLIVSPLEQFIRGRYEGDNNVPPITMHQIREDVIGAYQNVNDKQLGRVMTAAFSKFKAGQKMVNGVRGTMYHVRLKQTITTNY